MRLLDWWREVGIGLRRSYAYDVQYVYDRWRYSLARMENWPEASVREGLAGEVVGQYCREYAAAGAAVGAAIVADNNGAVCEALEAVRRLTGSAKFKRSRTISRLKELRKIIVCEDCGAIVPEDESHDAGGRRETRIVCASCFDELCTCEDCGAGVSGDDITMIGECGVCDSCRDRGNYFRCDDCGEWFHDDVSYSTARRACVCGACVESYYYWESDNEYHSEPEPEERGDSPVDPDHGRNERGEKIWQWLRGRRGQRHRVEMPNNGIAEAGVVRIVDVVAPYNSDDTAEGIIARAVRYDLQYWLAEERRERDSELTEWVTRSGTLPKRLSKWFAKRGVKLSSDVLGKVGDIARQYCPKKSVFVYDVVGGDGPNGSWAEWEPGDYGEKPTSCWFGDGSYNGARLQLQAQHQGFAVRFYDPDDTSRGVGRCWVIVENGIAFLFNAYGPYSLLSIARMLSQEAGAIYHEVKSFEWSEAYINPCKAEAQAVGYCADDEFPKESYSIKGIRCHCES
jgi:hypothetical protein